VGLLQLFDVRHVSTPAPHAQTPSCVDGGHGVAGRQSADAVAWPPELRTEREALDVNGTSSTTSQTEQGIVRTRETVTERLRAEFIEMPGLRLTSEQVQRLCGVERRVCQMVLDALVDAKFLARAPDGAYARLTDGAVAYPRHRHTVTRLPSGAVAAGRGPGS